MAEEEPGESTSIIVHEKPTYSKLEIGLFTRYSFIYCHYLYHD